MSKSRIDLAASKISNISQIEAYAEQLKKPSLYQNATNNELIHQNRKILDILKKIESKIDRELQIHRKSMLATNPHHQVVFNKDQMRLLQDKELNNAKLLTVLQKDLQNILSRKKRLSEGLQDKVRQKKNDFQDKILELKAELKKLSQEQKDTQKKLKAYENLSEADYFKQYHRMEEELRIYSAKYVKILSRYNKLTEQVAASSQTQTYFQIPEQIYNNLDAKQQAQYKEYQSIVKLCTILSKRNDSQGNKSNRIYTERLKQLERTILHLTELQKSISFKEMEILEGKKNIDMIKFKLSNQDKVEKEMFRFSQGVKNSFADQLRRKSYSSVKLLPPSGTEDSFNKNKLRSRGISFTKLPNKLKP